MNAKSKKIEQDDSTVSEINTNDVDSENSDGTSDWTELLLKRSQIAANFTLIASLVVATLTYVQQADVTKKNFANQLLAQFHSDRIYVARENLNRLWSEQDLSLLKSGLPRDTIEILIDKTILARKMSANQVDTSIVQITQFLDEIGTCRGDGACDATTVDKRLGSYARNFYCVYRGRIEDQATRRLLPDFGRSLGDWITKIGGCKSK